MVTKTERERLAVVETDTKWIKEKLKEMVPKIDEMHNTFSKGEGKISTLNKTVFGSGENEGIKKKVDDLEDYHQQRIGRNKFVNIAIGSGWLVTLILLSLNIAGVI